MGWMAIGKYLEIYLPTPMQVFLIYLLGPYCSGKKEHLKCVDYTWTKKKKVCRLHLTKKKVCTLQLTQKKMCTLQRNQHEKSNPTINFFKATEICFLVMAADFICIKN